MYQIRHTNTSARHWAVYGLAALGAAATLLAATPIVRADSDKHGGGDDGGYKVTNLVSDMPGVAAVTDPNLVNPWGVSFSPTSPFWISDNGTGLSTLYNGAGAIQSLVVTVPPPAGSSDTSAPTGQVFNGTTGFAVTGPSGTGPAAFIFATEDGTISGWSPKADLHNAILTVDRSAAGAVYKGLAMASVDFFGLFQANLLYATNFHSGQIDVFDDSYRFLGSFTDPRIPRGYAPFGISTIQNVLVVTYAKQDADKHDDVAGPGNGYVDVFSPAGFLLTRFASRGALNSPWGIALAPSTFGQFAGDLLIGDFGDGRINAYDPENGRFQGQVRDAKSGRSVDIDGLWALIFGNGGSGGDVNTLYFTAGPDGEQHGLFGSIQAVPANRRR